jgi:hypothetical protein
MENGHMHYQFMSAWREYLLGRVALIVITASAAGLAAISAQAQSIQLKPGVIKDSVMHEKNARNYAYCEIAPVLGTPPNVIAQFYNTTGTTGPGSKCPPDKFVAIEGKKLAEALKADGVYMNPSPQTARRHWVMDELWAFKAGETVDFWGVKATWVATMSPEQMRSAVANPYTPVEIHRESKYLYKKGSTAFLMRAPGGKTWVMQSYATEVDKNLAFEQLPQLASKLKLPEGWKFDVRKLTQDLTIEPTRAKGVAHIVRDELHNVYEGCGFDAACNYVP